MIRTSFFYREVECRLSFSLDPEESLPTQDQIDEERQRLLGEKTQLERLSQRTVGIGILFIVVVVPLMLGVTAHFDLLEGFSDKFVEGLFIGIIFSVTIGVAIVHGLRDSVAAFYIIPTSPFYILWMTRAYPQSFFLTGSLIGMGIGLCLSVIIWLLKFYKRQLKSVIRFVDLLSPMRIDRSPDVVDWCNHTEIADYQRLVARLGRVLTEGEYRVMKTWIEGEKDRLAAARCRRAFEALHSPIVTVDPVWENVV